MSWADKWLDTLPGYFLQYIGGLHYSTPVPHVPYYAPALWDDESCEWFSRYYKPKNKKCNKRQNKKRNKRNKYKF